MGLFIFVLSFACQPRVQTTTQKWNVIHMVRVDETLFIKFKIDPSIEYQVGDIDGWIDFSREKGLIFHDDVKTVEIVVEPATDDTNEHLCFSRKLPNGYLRGRCTNGISMEMSPEIPR